MRTVFLGDSITAGWNVGAVTANAINQGVSGNRLSDMAARFWEDVVQYDPDRLFILGGTNDHIWNQVVTIGDIAAMTRRATRQSMRVFAGTILPNNAWTPIYRAVSSQAALNAAVLDFNARIRDSSVYGYTVVDFYPSFVNPDGSQKAELFLDGVHPNAAGYAVMTALASQALLQS